MGWRGETDTSDRSFSSPFPTVFRDVEDLVCVLCSFRPGLRVPSPLWESPGRGVGPRCLWVCLQNLRFFSEYPGLHDFTCC